MDPVDDCTFWYTTEYYPTTSQFNWRTRIGSFKFPGCGGSPTRLQPNSNADGNRDTDADADADANPDSDTNSAARCAEQSDGDCGFSPRQINLAWTDNSNNESGFKIERCQGNGCSNFAQIAQVGANVTTFPDTGLSPNTRYRYRVRAFNGAVTPVIQTLPAPGHRGDDLRRESD